MSIPCLRRELTRGEDGDANRPSQAILGLAQDGRESGQSDTPDHDQVDVAGGELLGARHRAMDERVLDAGLERLQEISQDIDQPRGLDEQPLQLAEDLTRRVGPVVDMLALGAPLKDADLGQRGELGLDHRGLRVELASEGAHVPLPLRLEQQGCEYLLAGAREERVEKPGCSHIQYVYTQLKYDASCGLAARQDLRARSDFEWQNIAGLIVLARTDG